MSTTTPSAVLSDLIDRFHSREAVGLKKYGTTLDRTDLSPADLRQHLLEELMDGCLYLVGEQHAAQQQAAEPVEQPRGDGVVALAEAERVAQMAYIAGKRGYSFDGYVAELRAASAPRPAVEVTDEMCTAAVFEFYRSGKGLGSETNEGRARRVLTAALAAHPHTGYSAVPDGWVASFKAAVQAIEEDEQPITSACSFLLIDQCVTRNAKSVRLEFEDVYGSDGESFGNWTVFVERTAAPEVPKP